MALGHEGLNRPEVKFVAGTATVLAFGLGLGDSCPNALLDETALELRCYVA